VDRARLNERILDLGAPVPTWEYLRRGPLHIINVLGFIGVGGQAARGYETMRLKRCGIYRDADKVIAQKGPLPECVRLGYAKERPEMTLCLRPEGSVPTGAPTKTHDGTVVCGCLHHDGPVAKGAQTSISHISPSPGVLTGKAAEVVPYLTASLKRAANLQDPVISTAAQQHLKDGSPSVEGSYLLGAYIYGLMSGERPWSKERERTRAMLKAGDELARTVMADENDPAYGLATRYAHQRAGQGG
jgi:hypothetical protein